MAKLTEKIDLEALKKELRRVVLTGVGAAVMAKEGAVDLAKKFLSKGEDVEPELKKAFKSLMERRRKVAEKAGGLRTKAEGGLRALAKRLPIVTRQDFQELSGRIEALASKVDTLAKRRK